jgi:acetylglutamate synthase
VREIKVSKFSDFCNSFQSQATENWKERWPNEVLALGMISEIHLLERVLRVGVVIVTSELG